MESLEKWLTQPEGVATRLRAMRVRAGLSGKELSDANGWAQSKVSRIENGKQMPSAGDIEAWCRACGASADTVVGLLRDREEARVAHATFSDRMRHGQAPVQETYNNLVRGARVIRHFETVYIPGLLQTPGYARRVLTEMIGLHNLEIDDVDASVAARMERQRHVYDPAKRFEFLLFEPVLRTHLVDAAVMRAQLDRLQTVIGLGNVRFGVIPMAERALTWTPQASVQIYESDDTVAVTEDLAGEHWHREEGDVVAYGRGIDLLWNEAAEGDEARRLISLASSALT